VFAFVLDNVDDTFRSGQEIRSLLSVPALAQVQAVRRSPFGKLRILLSRGKGGGPGPELLHSSDVPLPMVEEYRRLRAAVLFPSQLPSPKKILVTSTLPGEGKTTTTANVALSLAQCDRRVLLVDADLRKPRLHQIFGLSNSRGLSDLLLAEGTPDATEYIAKRVAENLDLLVAGSKSLNPAELLGSERMKATTEALLGSYDHVIFDSPSAVSAVDGLVLARAVDGVLFVVRAGKVSRTLVNETLNDLRGTGAPLLGVVLNNAEPGAFNRYYG
jgi:capsular exopolysaccharide synthesis family protein